MYKFIFSTLCISIALMPKAWSTMDTETTELHRAVSWRTPEEIQVALEHISPVERDENRWTPAHIAAQKGKVEALKLLKEAYGSANLFNLLNDKNDTPLHVAIRCMQVVAAKYMIAEGADVNAYNDKYTPLHLAALHNHRPEFMLYLVRSGANPRLQTLDCGGTLFHCAASIGYWAWENLVSIIPRSTSIRSAAHQTDYFSKKSLSIIPSYAFRRPSDIPEGKSMDDFGANITKGSAKISLWFTTTKKAMIRMGHAMLTFEYIAVDDTSLPRKEFITTHLIHESGPDIYRENLEEFQNRYTGFNGRGFYTWTLETHRMMSAIQELEEERSSITHTMWGNGEENSQGKLKYSCVNYTLMVLQKCSIEFPEPAGVFGSSAHTETAVRDILDNLSR